MPDPLHEPPGDDSQPFDESHFVADDDMPTEQFIPEGVAGEEGQADTAELGVSEGAADDSPVNVDDPQTEIDDLPHVVTRNFEDLTLLELLGHFFRAPRDTMHSFSQVTHASIVRPDPIMIEVPTVENTSIAPDAMLYDDRQGKRIRRIDLDWLRSNRQVIQLGLFVLALVLAWWGNSLLVNAARRTEVGVLVVGAPFLLLGFLIWLAAEVFGGWSKIVAWWAGKDSAARYQWFARVFPVALIANGFSTLIHSFNVPQESALSVVQQGLSWILMGVVLWIAVDLVFWFTRRSTQGDNYGEGNELTEGFPSEPSEQTLQLPWWMQIHPSRIVLVFVAVLMSMVTWGYTFDDRFQPINLVLFEINVIPIWIASVLLWALVFAPIGWRPLDQVQKWTERIRTFSFRQHRTLLLVMAAIMLLGGIVRFYNIFGLPSEMTDDHVEKLLDSHRVATGEYDIFFANNGGREPFQMYAMAIFSQLPGQGINHASLKMLAAIESLLSLPFLFWMGYEVVGARDRKLGIITGLLLMALMAVSYWHLAITRQALRIVLTPWVTALLVIYLSRAMRRNQRVDFIKAGLVLGFGLYTYQAVRMLPVVVVAGVGLAMLIRARGWRDWGKYALHLLILVWISFMAFLPLFHYSLESPDHFWMRTTGRLLGDDIVTETNENGQVVYRESTLADRVEAFNENIPLLMSNIRNVLLMFNWKGDVGWISGVSNHPAMDPMTGALLIVGLAAWATLIARSRDPVYWLIPVMLFIMLLPSALSLAFPLENPSNTRTSGAIPAAYLLAAFPLGLLVRRLLQVSAVRGKVLAAGLVIVVILGAFWSNMSLYFLEYPEHYIRSTYPYSEGGEHYRGFATSNGGWGNAFLIGFPNWWSHRAVGLAAGLGEKWPGGIADPDGSGPGNAVDEIPAFLKAMAERDDRFQFDPERDILFFYSPADSVTEEGLKKMFPEGYSRIENTSHAEDTYKTYNVPRLSFEGFMIFLGEYLPDSS